MPIKVAGVVVNKSQVNEAPQPVQPPPPQPVVKVVVVEENPVDMTPPPRKIVKQKPTIKITDGHKLVVNGKEKTIGRKSQYLLDMLIIDDE